MANLAYILITLYFYDAVYKGMESDIVSKTRG